MVSDKKFSKLYPVYRFSLGEKVQALLEREHCEDVARNSDGSLWVKYTGKDFEEVGVQSDADAENLISAVAALQRATVNFDHPILETILPDGNRFEAVLPPLMPTPAWTIRARSKQVFSLDSYVENGMMTQAQYDRIVCGLTGRENILVSGGNGSGKTSFLNGLLAHLSVVDPKTRLGIIEDTPELRSSLRNHVAFLAGRKGSMLHCLKTCLRMRLDRIAIGEVRGKEALTMLKAFNTGYPGMATIHANNAQSAKTRLCGLVREAIPSFDAMGLVNENIHLIVQIDGPTPTRQRQISELLEVKASCTPA